MGEFLAIVHALAHCKKHNITLPIYSDSRTAIAWVRNRLAKTTLERTAKNARVFELIQRAEDWLCTNTYVNHILKWETELWGENPADFGRK
jgi:ribonuclease HI